MENIDYTRLLDRVVGQSVERPNRASQGTLSGHAAGEPFEKLVYKLLGEEYAGMVFKQYEYLNDLFLKHPKVISVQERHALIDSPTALFMLNRGNSATRAWKPDNLFEERQSDTADILIHKNGYYELIDVKAHNKNKHSQPPNIISAYKLAQMCTLMIDNDEFDTLGIKYIGVEWEEREDRLVSTAACLSDLFKARPDTLYINWAAAIQIQSHVAGFDQSWTGSRKEWAVAFIKAFVDSAQKRIKKMEYDYVKPFLPYIQ